MIALIQARMSSTRLPGKSLTPVNGIPLLQRVVDNAWKIPKVKSVFVLTSRDKSDDPIEAFCTFNNISFYRGDRLNVFKRFHDFILEHNLNGDDYFIRLTADNPVIDFHTTKKILSKVKDQDYVAIKSLSHIVPEFVKISAFIRLSNFNLSDSDFEHVTPAFRGKLSNNFSVKLFDDNFNNLRRDLDHLFTIDDFTDLKRLNHFFKKYDSDNNPENLYHFIDSGLNVKLGNKLVGENHKPFVIGEIGQNHNGSIDLAKELIDMAIRAGVDAVKFQKRDIPSELTEEAYNKPYDTPNSFGKTYGEHREFLELDESQHKELKEYCDRKGIIYFCTPCDVPSVDLLERIGVPFYKVASRDLSNGILLERLSKTDKPVIISTGMADYEEIDLALNQLNKTKNELIILQCTSEYPCSYDNVNLNVMKTLESKYGYIVGFSDHTPGSLVSAVAVSLGAKVIEKHITLDKTMKGTDQPGSLEENELSQLVKDIDVANRILGKSQKEKLESIKGTMVKLQRSITSAKDIKTGEILTSDMICLKSPGNGIPYKDKDLLLGKKATLNIKANTTLNINHFEN